MSKFIKEVLFSSILFSLAISFNSCSINKSVVGLYGKCEKGYFACTQIELKADNTFEYFIFMDVGGATILKGNWKKISKDSILLNTFEQPINPKTTYKGKINPSVTNDTIRIEIRHWEFPLMAAYLLINDEKEGKIVDENGFVEFQTKKLNTITYYYLGYKETISIDNPNYNEIEILVKDIEIDAFTKYLTDKLIIKRGKKVYFDPDYSLRRNHIKNKQWK